METSNQKNLEEARTEVEKIMMHLNGDVSDENHRHYLAGVIDTLSDHHIVSEDTRNVLYEEYCF